MNQQETNPEECRMKASDVGKTTKPKSIDDYLPTLPLDKRQETTS